MQQTKIKYIRDEKEIYFYTYVVLINSDSLQIKNMFLLFDLQVVRMFFFYINIIKTQKTIYLVIFLSSKVMLKLCIYASPLTLNTYQYEQELSSKLLQYRKPLSTLLNLNNSLIYVERWILINILSVYHMVRYRFLYR